MKFRHLAILLLVVCISAPAWAQRLADPFAQKLFLALEYVDYPDVLLGIAVNNPRIWERYDQAEFDKGKRTRLLERWVQATNLPSFNGDVVQEILTIHAVFEENPKSGFRSTPIDDAGGDIGRDPAIESFQPAPGFPRTQAQLQLLQSLKANPGFFDELSDEQLRVLQANPLLKVEAIKVSDLIAALGRPILDPSRTMIAPTQNLVRYQYPNAKRWREFATILSPALQQQLASAEAAGLLLYDSFNPSAPFNPANPARGGVSPAFRTLNQQLIGELLRARFDPKDTGQNFFKNYQRLIAVHPFEDYNGRTLRVLYRRAVGRPLFIVNFNHDLYTDAAAFGADVELGNSGLDFILSGMISEENAHRQRLRTNPSDLAKFYDLGEWWVFAAGKDDGNLLIQLARGDQSLVPRLVAESKRWISQIPIEQQIDKKFFDLVVQEFRQDLRDARILPR